MGLSGTPGWFVPADQAVRWINYERPMTYAENLWLFFVLLSGIIIVPGMDMFFVIANSLTGGKRAG